MPFPIIRPTGGESLDTEVAILHADYDLSGPQATTNVLVAFKGGGEGFYEYH